MKQLFLALILVFVFGSVFAVEAQSGEQVKVKINKQKTATRDRIKIKFVSLIEDSRCPEGTDCIWAGNAKIKIEVKDRRGRTETFEVNTELGAKGAVFNGYAINLTSLTPTPKANVKLNRNAYTATFSISRMSR